MKKDTDQNKGADLPPTTTFPVYAALKFDSFDQDCFEVNFGDKTKVEVCYIFSLGDGIFRRL